MAGWLRAWRGKAEAEIRAPRRIPPGNPRPAFPPGRNLPVALFCNGPLSNWAASPFSLDGHDFHSLEQYLMWGKAELFGDAASGRRILGCAHAAEAKRMGREVRCFDGIAWYCRAKGILRRGAALGKFRQHPPSAAALLATAGTILAEASCSDRVWGIGLDESDPRSADPSEWRGTNWLGEVLTGVREGMAAEARAAGRRNGNGGG